jgi:DNA-binding LytR/AlgR family response regulator
MLAILPAPQPTLCLFDGVRGRQERPITDLIYMQSDENYTWLVWCNGDRTLMPRTMKYYETRLPTGQFMRIHRHHAINIEHIDRVEWAPNQLTVRLSNAERLSVSRRKLAEIRVRLQQYIQC